MTTEHHPRVGLNHEEGWHLGIVNSEELHVKDFIPNTEKLLQEKNDRVLWTALPNRIFSSASA